MNGETKKFLARDIEAANIRETIKAVYTALDENGYDPVNRIIGYIVTQDPTYITSRNNARNMIVQLERDDILRELIVNYIKK